MSELEDLKAALALGRERLLQVISGVSEDQFKKRPPAPADGGPQLVHRRGTGPPHAAGAPARRPHPPRHPAARRRHHPLDRRGALRGCPRRPRLAGASARSTVCSLPAARSSVLLDQAALLEAGLGRAVVHPRLGRQTIAWMPAKSSSPTKPSTSPRSKPSRPPLCPLATARPDEPDAPLVTWSMLLVARRDIRAYASLRRTWYHSTEENWPVLSSPKGHPAT